jgi:4-oxalocrotonate tautomerase family enzyme
MDSFAYDFRVPRDGRPICRSAKMPIIQCDIRRGRTEEQKRKLAAGLTDAVVRIAGIPKDHIFLVIREMPGFNFVDAGEHVPDYVPGANGEDLAGAAQLRERHVRVQK